MEQGDGTAGLCCKQDIVFRSNTRYDPDKNFPQVFWTGQGSFYMSKERDKSCEMVRNRIFCKYKNKEKTNDDVFKRKGRN